MSEDNIEMKLEVIESEQDSKTVVSNNIENLILSLKDLTTSNDLISVSKEVEAIKASFYTKLKSIDKDSEKIEKEFKLVYNKYKKEKNILRKKLEEEEEKNLKIKKDIINEIKELTLEVEIKKETYKKFKELQNKWRSTGHVSIRYKNDIWQTYNHFVEVFYDYLKLNNDLRDLDFKKNLEVKVDLCKQAENLINEKSLNKMHQELQLLHEKWKNIGPVNKDERESIWERFQEASKKINKKRNDFYTDLKQKDKEKINLKTDLCNQINDIAKNSFKSHHDCEIANKEVENIVTKWKALGRVNKNDNKECWKQLRESLNNFYKVKNNFYRERKKENKHIIKIKTQICENAEKLEKNTNWQETSKKIIDLQKKWKRSGHVFGKTNDALWLRFKKSCDNFFEAKKNHQSLLLKEEKKNIIKYEEIISKISKYKMSKDFKETVLFIEQNIEKWKKIEVNSNNTKLESKLKNVINELLDKQKFEKKELQEIKNKFAISLIKGNKKELEKHKTNLVQKITEKNKEIDQYETNKSFFVSNKSNDPLLKQINKKIEKLVKETDQLKKELKLLNNF